MKDKNITLYMLIAGISLSLTLFYSILLHQLMKGSSRELLLRWTESTRTQVEENIAFQARHINFLAATYRKEVVSGPESLIPMLIRMNVAAPDRYFFAIDKDGTCHLPNGQTARINQKETAILEMAATGGVALARFASFLETGVCIIVPLDTGGGGRNGEYFVGCSWVVSDFTNRLLVNCANPGSALTLFDERGKPIAAKGKVALADTRFMRDNFLKAMRSFLDNEEGFLVKMTGFWGDSAAFSRLPSSMGWFVASDVPIQNIVPFYSRLFYLAWSSFMVQLFLFLFLARWALKKRRTNAKNNRQGNLTDPLTGLLNGFHMESELAEDIVKKFLEDAENANEGCCLICLDVAFFSRFNNMFGRRIGDQLLRAIGRTLKQNDLCGIYNGIDHFSLVAKNKDVHVEELNARLRAEIANHLGKQYLSLVTFNFGVYTITDFKKPIREMHDNALLALRIAKADPKSNVAVYDEKLKEQVEMERRIETNMIYALSKEEFHVYVQPKYSLSNGTCCCGEALVRWHSEELGLLQPGAFIPLFERNGFIVEIDFFVLSFVFRNIHHDLAAGRPVHPISVNQSKATLLFPHYLDRLNKLAKEFPIPHKYIDLEVTESIMEEDHARMLALIKNVKALGFSISLDDFGSGYSSLNTLRELPVDTLKIDKDFLKESDISDKSKKILRNIINMSKDLEITVVCEGVENKSQLDFLREIGCDLAQGYYCAKPMPFLQYIERYLSPVDPNRLQQSSRTVHNELDLGLNAIN